MSGRRVADCHSDSDSRALDVSNRRIDPTVMSAQCGSLGLPSVNYVAQIIALGRSRLLRDSTRSNIAKPKRTEATCGLRNTSSAVTAMMHGGENRLRLLSLTLTCYKASRLQYTLHLKKVPFNSCVTYKYCTQ